MIANYEISVSMEHVVKSKIGPIFVNEEILEEYSIRIYEIDSYFYEHYKKRYKLVIMIKNTYCLEFIFILLNILYQQKLMKKVILTEILFLKKKDKWHQKKKLNCTFIRINTSKKNYYGDYEASRIQTFISSSNKNKIKEL